MNDQQMREWDEFPEDDALGDKPYTYTATEAPVDDPAYQGRVLRNLERMITEEYRQDLYAAGGKAKNLFGEQRVPLLYELWNRILGDDSSRELRQEAIGQLRYLERKELEHWISGSVEKMYELAGYLGEIDPGARYELEGIYRSLVMLLEEHCELDLKMPPRYPEPKSESTNGEENIE